MSGNGREEPAGTPLRLLLVDDDPSILDIMARHLSGRGIFCLTAADGVAALEKLKSHTFDIVITDMAMPRMNGMALLEHIKKSWPGVSVIVSTGYDAAYTYSSVIKAGASDFITKPFEMDELSAKIDRLERERDLVHRLEELSNRDPLTGLYNRRYFSVTIEAEASRAERQGYDLFVAIADIDRFKQYNDALGHQKGDELLVETGRILEECTRRHVDWAFRYGGDELGLVLVQLEVAQAIAISERVIQEFMQRNFEPCGLSIGLACFVRGKDTSLEEDIDDLLRRADRAMYSSKKEGICRVFLDCAKK